MKNVLLTGATGFLGKHLLSELNSHGFGVTALCRNTPNSAAIIPGVRYVSGDIEDPLSLFDGFSGTELVIHAAALVSMNPADNHKMYQTNVIGTRNVVNACLRAGVKRLIHVSSVAALSGTKKNQVLNEDGVWDGLNAGYGYTKYLAELEVYRGESEGLEVAIVNPSIILGPGDAHRSSGMIFDFIRRGWPFALEGTANVVDARDVTQAIVQLADHPSSGERYILNGFTMNWSHLFTELAARTGRSIRYYEIPTGLATGALWVLEKFLKMIQKSPKITAHAVRMATSGNRYATDKIVRDLGFQFRSPESTLDWASS